MPRSRSSAGDRGARAALWDSCGRVRRKAQAGGMQAPSENRSPQARAAAHSPVSERHTLPSTCGSCAASGREMRSKRKQRVRCRHRAVRVPLRTRVPAPYAKISRPSFSPTLRHRSHQAFHASGVGSAARRSPPPLPRGCGTPPLRPYVRYGVVTVRRSPSSSPYG